MWDCLPKQEVYSKQNNLFNTGKVLAGRPKDELSPTLVIKRLELSPHSPPSLLR